jgi:hypothetical protein
VVPNVEQKRKNLQPVRASVDNNLPRVVGVTKTASVLAIAAKMHAIPVGSAKWSTPPVTVVKGCAAEMLPADAHAQRAA